VTGDEGRGAWEGGTGGTKLCGDVTPGDALSGRNDAMDYWMTAYLRPLTR